MVETRLTKAKKQKFKKRFTPLLDEFYQLQDTILIDEFLGQGTVPQEEYDHPQRFLHIKERLELATYDNVKQIVEDMRHITSSIPTGETEESKSARKLELYIDKTIEPIEHAEGILELYQLDRGACIQLDENNSLADNTVDEFYYSSKKDRLKMSLRWPLPALPEGNQTLIARANLSGTQETISISSVPTPIPIQDEPNADSVREDGTFEMEDGTKYNVGVITWREMFKFSICIKGNQRSNQNGSNKVNRSRFVSKYVDRYLKSDPLYRIKIGPFESLSSKCQKYTAWVDNEHGMRMIMRESIYDTINQILLATLDDFKPYYLMKFESVIKDRKYIRPSKDTGNIGTPKEGKRIEFEAELSTAKVTPLFFGQNVQPDLQVFYRTSLEEPRMPAPVIYTGIGEIKYITFDLVQCLKDLEGPEKWNQPVDGEDRRRSRIKEVEDTLLKCTTTCLYLGISRFVLSDLDSFLFVKLNFEQDYPPVDYGTNMGEKGEYLKAEYSCFTHSDPYVRLYYLSFFAMNDEFLNESEEFRRSLETKLHKEEERLKNLQQEEMAKELNSGAIDRLGESQVKPNSQSEISLTFDKTLFKRPSYVELGDVITQLVEFGPRISQVVRVDSLKFCEQIFEENIVEKKSNLPRYSILKVFDPFQGQLLSYDPFDGEYKPVNYSYQLAINYSTREIRAYCRLSQYGGIFIPRLLAYGRLSDLHLDVADIYCQLCGGYLMIEEIKKGENFQITKDFFNKKILKLYRRMHLAGVVQGDVKWDNAIITAEGEFFIIDFSHSKFTEEESVKKAELDRVYREFGRPQWREEV